MYEVFLWSWMFRRLCRFFFGYQKLPLADFEKVVRWLLVFVTRYSIVANLDSSGMESIFYRMAREIRTRITGDGTEYKQEVKACMAYIKDTLVNHAPSDERIKA